MVLMIQILSSNAVGAAAHMTVQAATDKAVCGVVYDQAGIPIPGADVNVEIWGGSWPDQAFFRTSISTGTNASGYYEVVFSSNYWSPHNTIRVIVNYGSSQKSYDVEANEEGSQTVDMVMNLMIPEFGWPYSVLAIIAGCLIPASILLARRRR